jgi:hypothetical protein
MMPPTTFFMDFVPNSNSIINDKSNIDEKLQTIFPSISRLLIDSERQTLRNLKVPIISLQHLIHSQPTTTDRKAAPTSRSLKLFDECSRSHQSSSSSTSAPSVTQLINEDFIEDILEWIGAMHCRVRSYLEGDEIDPAISLVNSSALERASMQGLVFKHEGFINPAIVIQQLKQAKSIVDGGFAPYSVLTAWAFADQPLQHLEHFRDAYYTIVVLEKDHYLLIKPSL